MCVWRTGEHGLAPCPVLASSPARSEGSPPDTLNTHSPTSLDLLHLTSYTPENTDINLLRTAAQMLAMWTKGPWERDEGRGQEQGSRREALWHSMH